ncbi:MAG: Gfo/Idh/MocA family oxidoreductase [Candidatus Latescibacteria bacterium]|jgi:UDP-N-acetylglucosamine 3-dehydrogenase|nr:Gfo/Idh/MocA family oxidoreductase [Candidatus Latescibacterota bacterium]
MKILDSPINIAIAGLGDVSQQHRRAIEMCDNARLTGVWTRNSDKLKRLSEQWQVSGYPDYDALLSDDSVDVVDITAADSVHYDFTLRALDAGKHVIVEKPPGENSAHVIEMQAASEKAGRYCIPMHNYVYRPRMIQAKELIEEGRLGAITFGFFSEVMNMPEEWASHYHGVLVTAMYHLIYSSLFLMGKPDRIFAQQESLHYTDCKDDDLTTVHLHYPGGAMAVLLGNWTADDLTANSWFSMYKLIGTKGGVNISGHDALVYHESGWGSLQWPDYEDTFQHAFDYIVRKCLLEGSPPLSGLDEAITTMKMIELAQRSSREKISVEV